MLAPYNDPDWQIWACSPDNVTIGMPRIDAWFELHGDLDWERPPRWEFPYINWLNEQKFDLYVQRTDLFPRGIAFPKEDMVKRFGTYWFTSSFAWMMAFAITKGPEVIGLFGADMAETVEYRAQRPAMIYFAQVAAQENIGIYAPPESDVLRPPPLYGYSVSTPMGRKLAVREREVRERLNDVKARKTRLVRELDHEIDHLTGALDDLDYVRTNWTGEAPEGMDNDA